MDPADRPIPNAIHCKSTVECLNSCQSVLLRGHVSSPGESRQLAHRHAVLHLCAHRCEFTCVAMVDGSRSECQIHPGLRAAFCPLDATDIVRAYVSACRVLAHRRKYVVPLDVCTEA